MFVLTPSRHRHVASCEGESHWGTPLSSYQLARRDGTCQLWTDDADGAMVRPHQDACKMLNVLDVPSKLKIIYYLIKNSSRTTGKGSGQVLNPGPSRRPNFTTAGIPGSHHCSDHAVT